jgi:hypothetical protein
MDQDVRLQEAIAKFPGQYEYLGYPGKPVRINVRKSYMSKSPVKESDTTPILYLEMYRKGEWRDFYKGTIEELQPCLKPFQSGRSL